MDVSENIRRIREEKRLKQADIAYKLKIDKGNYSRTERKGHKLTLKELISISEALGVSLKELLFGMENTENPNDLQIAFDITQQKLAFELEKSASLTNGLLNHIRRINTYLPTQPLQTDIGEDLQPNNYKIFLTYRCEFKGKHYTLAHWEKSIRKEESFYIRNGHQENLGKRLLNKGPKTTQKEREHAAYIQDIAYQNIKTNHNLWAIYFLNIEEFFKSVFEALQ